MGEKLFKFKISDVAYPSLVARDLGSVQQILGDFEVVKVRRHWWLKTDMYIWVKKVNKKDKE